MSCTPRDLSFESDKLHAITGYLNFISEIKDISPFVVGLPSVDFHYALLWYGEYDRPRLGFLSWPRAAWPSLQNHHLIYSKEKAKTILQDNGTGDLHTIHAWLESEMEGLLISLTERPHHKNRCLQNSQTFLTTCTKPTHCFRSHHRLLISLSRFCPPL